jgi:hypothetical protein
VHCNVAGRSDEMNECKMEDGGDVKVTVLLVLARGHFVLRCLLTFSSHKGQAILTTLYRYMYMM